MDPDKVRKATAIAGFRFVNPKTLANHANRKQERVNIMRLYGYLVQEKIFHEPNTIKVYVAELLPRYGGFECNDRYPDYFSTETYWTYDRLWNFIGVPYDVVPAAVKAVSKEFGERLISGLQRLLPDHDDGTLFGKSSSVKKRG